MKKIILCTMVALSIEFAPDAMALQEAFERTKGSELYYVVTNPPVTIRQVNGYVSLGLEVARSMEMTVLSYNEIVLNAPLIINGKMTPEEMVTALDNAFGAEVIKPGQLPAVKIFRGLNGEPIARFTKSRAKHGQWHSLSFMSASSIDMCELLVTAPPFIDEDMRRAVPPFVNKDTEQETPRVLKINIETFSGAHPPAREGMRQEGKSKGLGDLSIGVDFGAKGISQNSANPPVRIIKKTDGTVLLRFMAAPSINVSALKCKEIFLRNPLSINGRMTQNEMLLALYEAFGAVEIIIINCDNMTAKRGPSFDVFFGALFDKAKFYDLF